MVTRGGIYGLFYVKEAALIASQSRPPRSPPTMIGLEALIINNISFLIALFLAY